MVLKLSSLRMLQLNVAVRYADNNNNNNGGWGASNNNSGFLSTHCIDKFLLCMRTLHECGSNFLGLTSAACLLVDNNNNNGGGGANNNNSKLSRLVLLRIKRSWSEKRACIKLAPVQIDHG